MLEILWPRTTTLRNEIIICMIMTFISFQQFVVLYRKAMDSTHVYYVMICFFLLLSFVVLRTMLSWNRLLFGYDISNKLNLVCGICTCIIFIVLFLPIFLNIFSYKETDNYAIYGTNSFGSRVNFHELTFIYKCKPIIFSIKEKLYFMLQFFLPMRKMLAIAAIYRNDIINDIWRDNILKWTILCIKKILNKVYQCIIQQYLRCMIYLRQRQVKRCILHLAYQRKIPTHIINDIYNMYKIS